MNGYYRHDFNDRKVLQFKRITKYNNIQSVAMWRHGTKENKYQFKCILIFSLFHFSIFFNS